MKCQSMKDTLYESMKDSMIDMREKESMRANPPGLTEHKLLPILVHRAPDTPRPSE